jgi:hypothetical protein
MAEAKWFSGDRHFYAIAISRWDNEGGATGDAKPSERTNNRKWPLTPAVASFTSRTADGLRALSYINGERA